jgi:outer membrane protein OmpU
MNKFKKIGLTALAGSLVATSAFAGAMSVSGGASMAVEHINGAAASGGKSFYMGNQLTFTGSGELDNGLNVSLSFIIDQADDTSDATTTAPFDSHSVTVSSDSLGSLTFHGEGGSTAVNAIDGSAAGGMWDNFQATADEPKGSKGSDDMIAYALPSIMDGLALTASYTPNGIGFGGADASTSFAAVYTGMDGLTIKYGVGEDNSAATTADVDAWHVSYAYGPITVTATDVEYDHTTDTSDRSMDSQAISYTLSDEISFTYGQETITDGASGAVDAEFDGFSASYTSGGMTIKAVAQDAANHSYTTATAEDNTYWALSASFAF